jgi:hypothetical protein
MTYSTKLNACQIMKNRHRFLIVGFICSLLISCTPVPNAPFKESVVTQTMIPNLSEAPIESTISENQEHIQVTESVTIDLLTPETNISSQEEVELTAQEEIMSSFEIGNTILSAIDSYYQDVGQYPASLDDLTPKYLSEIPTTITNQEFDYYLVSPEVENLFIYRLSFTVSLKVNTGCSYFSPGGWECGINNPH